MSSKSTLSVRIPENMHKYIKYKAIQTGKQQQEVVAEIIGYYQKNDAEYMAQFMALTQPKESHHDA